MLRPVPTPTSMRNDTSSTPSSRLRARASSTTSSLCSTPMSCCAPTVGPKSHSRPQSFAGRRVWPHAPSRSRGLARRCSLFLSIGAAGVVVIVNAKPFAVMGFTVRGGRVIAIDVIADRQQLGNLDTLAILDL